MLKKSILVNAKTFKVSIGAQTHCAVSSNKAFAAPGEVVTLTVSYPTGYSNATVSVSPSVAVNKVNVNTFTFVMPYSDVTVAASASVLSFKISVNQSGTGTVNVKSVANYGETVTITASPGADYLLQSIASNDVTLSGSGSTRTFVMPARDVLIQVAFAEDLHGMVPAKMTVGGPATARQWYGYSIDSLGSLQPSNGYKEIKVASTGDIFCNPSRFPVRINGVTFTANGQRDTGVYTYLRNNSGKAIDILIQGGLKCLRYRLSVILHGGLCYAEQGTSDDRWCRGVVDSTIKFHRGLLYRSNPMGLNRSGEYPLGRKSEHGYCNDSNTSKEYPTTYTKCRPLQGHNRRGVYSRRLLQTRNSNHSESKRGVSRDALQSVISKEALYA